MPMPDRNRCARRTDGQWMISLALILPLLLSALFPVGLMPTEGRDGQMVMVLCSGNGPMLMVVDPVTGAYHQTPAKRGGLACDWAAAQAVPDLAGPIALPAMPTRVRRAGPAFTAHLWRPAHDPLGIWARGPPASI